MNRVANLARNEKISFMKVVYSLFYRDDKIEGWEKNIIKSLSLSFNFNPKDESEYVSKLFSDLNSVAQEINRISDKRTKIYLLNIIEETFSKSNKIWKGKETNKDSSLNFLKRKINL